MRDFANWQYTLTVSVDTGVIRNSDTGARSGLQNPQAESAVTTGRLCKKSWEEAPFQSCPRHCSATVQEAAGLIGEQEQSLGALLLPPTLHGKHSEITTMSRGWKALGKTTTSVSWSAFITDGKMGLKLTVLLHQNK